MSHLDTMTLTELPSVAPGERGALPETAAIYFVLADESVLYIGHSTCLRQRRLAHHRLAQLNEHGRCRIAWMTVDDASLLSEIERACIAHFRPVLNGSGIVGGDDLWVNARVSKETKAELEEWARKTRRSVSYLLRRLAEEAIEQGRAERGEQL